VNNLCTVNKNAGGEAVEVDRRLIDFILYAEELYELTNGEMDIMMGAVLRIWHDCREEATENPQNGRVPEIEELEAAREHTGFHLLEIDEHNCTLRIIDPEASIDVGALGKGYAVEQAAQLLEQFGTLENILKNADMIKKPSVRTAIESDRDRLRLNYGLIKLNGFNPVPFSLDETQFFDRQLSTTEVLKGIGLI